MTHARPLNLAARLALTMIVLVCAALLAWTALNFRAAVYVRSAQHSTERLDLAAASAQLQRASELAPLDARVHRDLGVALTTQWLFQRDPEQFSAASRAYERAARLSPNWGVPHLDLAALRAANGDMTGALRAVDGALQRDPNNAGYWLMRARYLERAGDVGAAGEAYGRCVALMAFPDAACVEGAR